jgi:hypothetical protein
MTVAVYVTDWPMTDGLCEELTCVWVEVTTLKVADPWKENSKTLLSHESWFV